MNDSNHLPQVNELVLGTISKIFGHGIYIDLDEYENVTAYCHISEISGTWIRNIRNFVRIGQKTVARVTRVNEDAGQIDVSIRRVPQEARRHKIQEWKRERTAKNLLKMVAERLGKENDEIPEFVETITQQITDSYKNVYNALEQSVLDGPIVFTELGIPENIAKEIHQIATENITISNVTISGIFGLRSFAPNGIERIRDALMKGVEIGEQYEDASVDIYTIGSPRYKVTVEAKEYQSAEKVLSEIVNAVTSYARENEIESVFEREKQQK